MTRLMRTALLLAGMLVAAPAYAEPPAKGTKAFKFFDPTAPRSAVAVCESLELIKDIVKARDHSAKFFELAGSQNSAGHLLCFAFAFTGDVIDDPIPVGMLFFKTHMSVAWAVHVRIGNITAYCLYSEPVLDKFGKPVRAKLS